MEGEITSEVPGFILQLHPDMTVIADEDELSLLDPKIKIITNGKM